MNNKLKRNLQMTLIVAIEIIFCFTPLGSIPIGPIVATLALLPVIFTSLFFGKRYGAFMGFVMATFSFMVWTFMLQASPVAFVFTPFSETAGYKGNVLSIVICFLPRILAGIVPSLIVGLFKNKIIGLVVASFIGSFTNTILVLLFIVLFFGKQYSLAVGTPLLPLIMASIITNGIPEGIIASIVCPSLINVIKKVV